MVNSCCVVGCHNVDDGTVHRLSFYRIPAASVDLDRRNKWISAISRKDWEPTVYTRLCSEHFISGDKSDDPLSPDYVPSLFPHTASPVKRRREQEYSAFLHRRESKKQCRMEVERQSAAEVLANLSAGNPHDSNSNKENDLMMKKELDLCAGTVAFNGGECGKFELKENCDSLEERLKVVTAECELLRTECQELRNENVALRDKIRSMNMTDLDDLKDNDEKVSCLTGVQSFAVLMTLFTFFGGKIKLDVCSSLSQSQQFLLTLMRLRLNLETQFLGYMFGIHRTTASSIFLSVVDVMHAHLLPTMLFWPDKESVYTSLPICFQMTFPKCVSIMDCFEIFCERPSDLKAGAQTFSSHKSHNTVKYLVSVTPQGFISFLSKGWSGEVSDKHVVENSGFLNHLLPGDVILADRMFSVEDSLALQGAELHVPAFTGGKPQPSAMEIEEPGLMAAVRLHVESVTGRLRQKYTFLGSTIPAAVIMSTDGVSSLDKIVDVCAALCNSCTAQVPQE